MRRNFFRGFLLCLIPTALAGLFTVMAFKKELAGQVGFRRGIDLAGGTILVYEIDVEGMKRKIAEENEANKSKVDFRERRYEDEQPDMRELAEKIKKRIDPSDLKNVVVRPVGEARIEIILPYSGSATDGNKVAGNEEFAEEVRQQVKQAGVLEFRILANETDDRPGIDKVMETLGGMRVDSTREQVSVTQERVAGPQRLAGLPNVPTFAEQGFPGVETVFFWVMLAPAGTPADVVARLNAALGQTLRDPAVRAEFGKQSMETSPGTSEEIARFMAAEIPRWRQVVQKAGIKQE